MRLLIDSGADASAADSGGWTPLHRTHTLDNHSHCAGVPRLKLAPIMGSPPHSLRPHNVVVWVGTFALESVRCWIPQGSMTKHGEVDPKTYGFLY